MIMAEHTGKAESTWSCHDDQFVRSADPVVPTSLRLPQVAAGSAYYATGCLFSSNGLWTGPQRLFNSPELVTEAKD